MVVLRLPDVPPEALEELRKGAAVWLGVASLIGFAFPVCVVIGLVTWDMAWIAVALLLFVVLHFMNVAIPRLFPHVGKVMREVTSTKLKGDG